jgi:NADH-quinone oxidoreductase subunit N
MPIVGAIMTLFMVSLTGLPPTAGFVGKFYIFASLINGGESFYWLVVAGGINSVISLYYYLRVVKVMYFEGDRKEIILRPSNAITGMLLVTAIPTLLLGIYWSPVSNWIERSLVFFIQTI